VAGADDVASMVRVVNEAFAVQTFLDGPRTDAQEMAEMLKQGEFLVAEDSDGRMLACVYTECHGERGYFGMLAVDPAQQGRGLGRMMVDAVEYHCRQRGCRYMDISILSLRTELPPFYRKLSYVETGTEEFRPSRPLRNGVECHKIVMSKTLSQV